MCNKKENTNRFNKLRVRVLNRLSLIGALSQAIYILIFIIIGQFTYSWNNLLFVLLMVSILISNYKNKLGLGLILYACTPILILNFTYVFGNIGAEYVQIVVITSSLFFWNTLTALIISIYSVVCFAAAKLMIAHLTFLDLGWARNFFYYINLSFSVSYVFYFVYIFKVESRHQHKIIEQKNENLDKKNQKLENLIIEIKDAKNEIRNLKGILPICSHCKKIRDDKGYWNQIEGYIQAHSDAQFSHGMCPKCSDEIYGKEDWYIEMKKEESQEE